MAARRARRAGPRTTTCPCPGGSSVRPPARTTTAKRSRGRTRPTSTAARARTPSCAQPVCCSVTQPSRPVCTAAVGGKTQPDKGGVEAAFFDFSSKATRSRSCGEMPSGVRKPARGLANTPVNVRQFGHLRESPAQHRRDATRGGACVPVARRSIGDIDATSKPVVSSTGGTTA